MDSFKCVHKNCGQTFATRNELISHKICHNDSDSNDNHNNNKSSNNYPIEYNCSECAYSVSNAALLQSHIEKHHKYHTIAQKAVVRSKDGVKSSSIEGNVSICDQKALQLHCDWPQCNAAYSSKISLMNHMRVHRKDKHYVTIKPNLGIKSHKNSITSRKCDNQIFNCILDDCPYTAPNSDELKNHIKGEHQIELLDEDYIGNNATQSSDQINHNGFSCFYTQCDYIGKTNKGYKIHLMKKHGYKASIAANERQSLVAVNNANVNVNIKSEPFIKLEIESDNTQSPIDLNENQTIKPIKTENLNDSNDKTKFILVNNNEPIDKIEDKTNVFVTTAAVKKKEFFHCSVENCAYRGISRNGLRFHILKSHHKKKGLVYNKAPINIKINKAINIKSNKEIIKEIIKTPGSIYKCPYSGCKFSTKSYEGLKVHLGKQHKQKAKDKLKKLYLGNETIGNNTVGFKCHIFECNFVGQNTHSLRIHLCNKHNIRIKSNQNLNNAEIKKPPEFGETSEDKVNISTIDTSNIKKEDKLTTTIERVDSFEELILKNQRKPKQLGNAYNCTIGGCDYIGKSFDARRMHIFKHHKEQRFTAYGYSTSIPNNNDVYAFNDNESKIPSVSLETNTKLYKCSVIGCNYINTSLKSVRIHRKNKHRRGFLFLNKNKKAVNEKSADNKVLSVTTNMTEDSKKDKESAKSNAVKEINQTVNQRSINNLDQINIDQINNNSVQIDEQLSNQSVKNRGKKFKCQFPGCRFSGDDPNTLKTHVQNTHKNNQNSDGSVRMPVGFTCYFPRCHFVGSDGVMLKQHIAIQHNYHIEAVKQTHMLFKCKYPNCKYSGSTTKKGLRIHFKRNHGRSVAKNVKYRQSINRSLPINQNPNIGIIINPSSSAAASPYQLFLEERRRQQFSPMNETSRKSMINLANKNQIKFRCHYGDCSFSVENLAALRSHHSEKHKNEFQ